MSYTTFKQSKDLYEMGFPIITAGACYRKISGDETEDKYALYLSQPIAKTDIPAWTADQLLEGVEPYRITLSNDDMFWKISLYEPRLLGLFYKKIHTIKDIHVKDAVYEMLCYMYEIGLEFGGL